MIQYLLIQYVLETFTEQRSIDEVYEPYNGAAIFKNGHMAPGLWDIKVSPLKLFEDQVHKTEIPNTAEVRVSRLKIILVK